MYEITAKEILSPQNGMNLYRGCSHGCIYCDTRSTCYQFDHPFEDIGVKANAPLLLDNALRHRRYRCMVGTGSMGDPYLPLEKTELLTRRCLEIIDKYDFGAAVLTKSDLVLRDLDLLTHINNRTKAVVQITLTTYEEALCRQLEPNVCTTARRIEVLKECQRAGIPTVVWFTPLLPFINDTEENLRSILETCFDADVKGILCFGIGVTLREGSRDHFYACLDETFPGMKQRYIEAFGNAYSCESPNHAPLMELFHEECRRHGVMDEPAEIFNWMHRFEDKEAGEQLSFL